MRMIHACLTSTDSGLPTATAVPLVHDLVWAHARPSDGLEHLRARPAPYGGLDVVLFVRARSDGTARNQMRALLGRVAGPAATHGFAIHLA
ncbi:hypothetical protein [Streptomyces bambusae]|uniref:Uncharacterized protein n=1 Tax=Streptomyces bambusae TaxID=1550616 RepID=A0ABS6Z217_9ACTN|nr:hypothetical protein [Streptomyces bambusae]MBW5481785.1 hypothetical protein [Streptomyces bambusae]